MYPAVCKTERYPVGHPTVICGPNISTDMNDFFGVACVWILPPKNLHLPVLPYRSPKGKLVFGLCKKCMDHEIANCEHSDEERGFIGCWVTPEIVEAQKQGYQVLRTYEVWHYDQTAKYDGQDEESGIWTPYINFFLRGKVEASGYPDDCITDEQKAAYVQRFYETEGVQLDPSRIEKNPARRTQCKLFLNTFWGKFAQRDNLSQKVLLEDPEKFFKLVFDQTNVVQAIDLLTDDVACVTYTKQDDYIEPSSLTSAVHASFVTAYGRLKLYNVLNAVGHRTIYFDTDSGKWCMRTRLVQCSSSFSDVLRG